MIQSLEEVAEIYAQKGKNEKSLPIRERILFIQEKRLGKDNPELVMYIEDYARNLDSLGKVTESKAQKDRAKQLRKQTKK